MKSDNNSEDADSDVAEADSVTEPTGAPKRRGNPIKSPHGGLTTPIAPAYHRHKKRSRSSGKKVDISTIKDQNEIAGLLDAYEGAYLSQHPERLLGRFNGRALLKTEDGACFQANPYIAIDSKKAVKDAVSTTLYDTLLNMIAFHLCMGTRSVSFPRTFKTTVMVNHDNAHWTAVNVTFAGGAHIRAAFGKIFRAYRDSLGDDYVACDGAVLDELPYALINQAKNFLTASFGDQLKLPLPFTQVSFEFMDSMGATSKYNKATKESCAPLMAATRSEFVNICPQKQKGNTCADHSVFNGFMGSVMGEVPVVSSMTLREITDNVSTAGHVDEGIAAISEIIASPTKAKRAKKRR